MVLAQLSAEYGESGWTFVAGNREELQPVNYGDPTRCIEDRPVIEPGNLGPAVPGGLVGMITLAAQEHGVSVIGLEQVQQGIEMMIEAGMTVAVHDMDPLHCGRLTKSLNGEHFDGIQWNVNAKEIQDAVEAAPRGVVTHTIGEHNSEAVLGINFQPHTTRPADGTQFHLDAYIAPLAAGVDPMVLVHDAIKTIEELGMPRVGVVWEKQDDGSGWGSY